MSFISRLLGRPNEDEFAQMVLKHLEQTGLTGTYDSTRFEIRVTTLNGRDSKYFLRTAFEVYRAAPRSERGGVIENFFQQAPEMPERFDDVRQDLLPKVRTRALYHNLRLVQEAEGGELEHPTFQPLGEDYALGIAVDFPLIVSEPGAKQVKKWG